MALITREEYEKAAEALTAERGDKALKDEGKEIFIELSSNNLFNMLEMVDRFPDIICGIQIGLRIASDRMAKDLERYASENTSRR